MDAVLPPLLVGGGLSVSVSVSTATRAISAFHLSPSALRSTARHRGRHRSPVLATASESPSTPLAAAMAESHSRFSRWVVVMDRPPAAAGGSGVSRAEAVDYYASTLAGVVGRLVVWHSVASWRPGAVNFFSTVSDAESIVFW